MHSRASSDSLYKQIHESIGIKKSKSNTKIFKIEKDNIPTPKEEAHITTEPEINPLEVQRVVATEIVISEVPSKDELAFEQNDETN